MEKVRDFTTPLERRIAVQEMGDLTVNIVESDICIVGAGVAGKYIASRLASTVKNGGKVSWISGFHKSYVNLDGESGENYEIDQHLGKTDTWNEKATGLITYPKTYSGLPMNRQEFQEISDFMKKNLNINYGKDLYSGSSYFDDLGALIQCDDPEYFDYAYDFSQVDLSQNKSILQDRDLYDQFWKNRKRNWSPNLPLEPTEATATRFIGTSPDLVLETVDKNGTITNIRSKKYVIACHTPGSIELFSASERTCFSDDFWEKLGCGFHDHPQLSFGALLPMEVRRDLPPCVTYQDFSLDQETQYRIEVHHAPPKLDLATGWADQMGVPLEHFHQHFARIVAVVNTDYSDSRIVFENTNGVVGYRVNDALRNIYSKIRNEYKDQWEDRALLEDHQRQLLLQAHV